METNLSAGLSFGPFGPNTVHLCVDMQRLFGPGSPWYSPWTERIIPTVEAVAGHCPERTVFTRFIPPRRADDMPGMWQHYYRRWHEVTRDEVNPALLDLFPHLSRFAPPATVIDKATYSPFSSGQLSAWLSEHSVDGLIITGAETDVCILATVLGAVDRGYRVTIVTDGICSSSDPGHDALLSLYHQRFSEQIEAADAAVILEAWRV